MPDLARARATRQCWHSGCPETVCDFHLSCRNCLGVNPHATVCGKCHNLNLPGDACMTLGCPAPGGRPYDPARDGALASELHGMTPGKYMARRPHFAPKAAHTAASGVIARRSGAIAEGLENLDDATTLADAQRFERGLVADMERLERGLVAGMERLGLGLIAEETQRALDALDPRLEAPGPHDPNTGSIMMTRVMAEDVAAPYEKARQAYGGVTSIGQFVTTLKMKGHK